MSTSQDFVRIQWQEVLFLKLYLYMYEQFLILYLGYIIIYLNVFIINYPTHNKKNIFLNLCSVGLISTNIFEKYI